MLVLSRFEGQSILVGDDIRVEVSSIRGKKVRIGFDAPDHVKLVRLELTRGHIELTRAWDDYCKEQEFKSFPSSWVREQIKRNIAPPKKESI